MAKDRESVAEVKERHRHEEAEGLVRDSTRRLDNGTFADGILWEDAARMALARKASDRNDQDWEAIGLHPDPRSGVTGSPNWETRRGN